MRDEAHFKPARCWITECNQQELFSDFCAQQVLSSFYFSVVFCEASSERSTFLSLCPWIVAASVTRWFLIIRHFKTLLLFSSPAPLITASQFPAAEKILFFFVPPFPFCIFKHVFKKKEASWSSFHRIVCHLVRKHVQALVFTLAAPPLMWCLKTSNTLWWFHGPRSTERQPFQDVFFFFLTSPLFALPPSFHRVQQIISHNSFSLYLVFPGPTVILLLLPPWLRIFALWRRKQKKNNKPVVVLLWYYHFTQSEQRLLSDC